MPTHTFRSGDNLYSVARRYFGNTGAGRGVRRIVNANRGSRVYRPGDRVRIPRNQTRTTQRRQPTRNTRNRRFDQGNLGQRFQPRNRVNTQDILDRGGSGPGGRNRRFDRDQFGDTFNRDPNTETSGRPIVPQPEPLASQYIRQYWEPPRAVRTYSAYPAVNSRGEEYMFRYPTGWEITPGQPSASNPFRQADRQRWARIEGPMTPAPGFDPNPPEEPPPSYGGGGYTYGGGGGGSYEPPVSAARQPGAPQISTAYEQRGRGGGGGGGGAVPFRMPGASSARQSGISSLVSWTL